LFESKKISGRSFLTALVFVFGDAEEEAEEPVGHPATPEE
jgi:hypothetical protein